MKNKPASATHYDELKSIVEATLSNAINIGDVSYQIVAQAMQYSLLAGGKRIRPILCLSTIEAFRPLVSEDVSFAINLELLHTYSLIHDDLPAMDDDDLRRGKPSCHVQFSEDVAILAGDALLNLAALRLLEQATTPPKQQAAMVVLKATGHDGMIGGQVLDLASGPKDYPYIQKMHQLKTGALIKAAIISGAHLAQATPEQIAVLSKVGDNLGLAFQICDDLLDVTSTPEVLGKTVGKDARDTKTTYVTLFGIKKAKELLAQVCSEASSALDTLGSSVDFTLLDALIWQQKERVS